MASLEEAIPRWVMEQPAVAALIVTRMFPATLLQPGQTKSELPAVSYEIISTREDRTLAGGRNGLCWSRMQFVAFAYTLRSAMAVARAMKNNGLTLLRGEVNGLTVRDVEIVKGIETSEYPVGDGDQQSGAQSCIHLAEFDIEISYLEQ